MLRIFTGVSTWWADLKGRVQDEEGATAVEYALMVALIAVVIIVAVQLLGQEASTTFDNVATNVGSTN